MYSLPSRYLSCINFMSVFLFSFFLYTISLHDVVIEYSLIGSFVPFGGFFSTPELKLPFSGFNKEITGPVSSVSDQTQSTLPPWLQMTTRIDLNQTICAKVGILSLL